MLDEIPKRSSLKPLDFWWSWSRKLHFQRVLLLSFQRRSKRELKHLSIFSEKIKRETVYSGERWWFCASPAFQFLLSFLIHRRCSSCEILARQVCVINVISSNFAWRLGYYPQKLKNLIVDREKFCEGMVKKENYVCEKNLKLNANICWSFLVTAYLLYNGPTNLHNWRV